jgi:putative DNA primase/helicase
MPNLATILKRYFPARFVGRVPLARRDAKDIVRAQTFQPVGLREFLALDVPPRAMLLDPILPERSLAMLYAPRGLGKSWLGLSIGLAVASGEPLLRWSAPRPRHVLYVDGEMQLADLQSRLNSIMLGLGVEIPNDRFRMLAADNTECGINLGSVVGQQTLETLLDGVDLVILDNLSTLMTTGSESASDAWLPMQNWLLRLRRKGIAALLIHHAGVNGRQRGTSRREDALDTVIGLRRPGDYSAEEGARFEVHIEKSRALAGEGALPFEAVLESFAGKNCRPGVRWTARDLPPPTFHQAATLFEAGMTVRQVAAMLEISRSEAGRLRLRAAAAGLLDDAEDDGQEAEIATDGQFRPN